jgi:hypothetical protein
MCCVLLAAGAVVVAEDWVRLGTKMANDQVDHDTIPVTSLRGDFRKLKIEVGAAGVDFHRVVIRYKAGDGQVVAMRQKIPIGGETRTIDLQGEDRVITSVEFWYDARSLLGRKAVVTLHGLK